MAKYGECFTTESADYVTKLSEDESMAPRDMLLASFKKPLWIYDKCREKIGIHKDVNLKNALRKCAKRTDSVDHETMVSAMTCELVLSNGSHNEFK